MEVVVVDTMGEGVVVMGVEVAGQVTPSTLRLTQLTRPHTRQAMDM